MSRERKEKSPLSVGKIMLVDNEEDLIKIYPREMRKQGLDIVGFVDPAIALKKFKSTPDEFILVISDIRMPKLDGFEFIRTLKEIKPEIKVAFITAFEIRQHEFIKVLPSTKVEGLIKKPISPKKLSEVIKGILKTDEVNNLSSTHSYT
jgi:response regulator RpfG family c-di-GMP phosphodiesterase